MNKKDRQILIQNRVLLVEKLQPELLCDYFVQSGMISLEISESILHPSKCRRPQARELLDIVIRRGPNAFGIFINGLRMYQPNLMDAIVF
jgi:hypothetical protein